MNCKNCKNDLSESWDYCNTCGGKVIRNRLTIKNLFEHAIEQFLSIDNKFLITFRHLFTKPEEVIDGYISGLRKKYINPISYLAIALTLSGVIIFLIQKLDLQEIIFSQFPENGQEKFQEKLKEFSFEYSSIMFLFYIPTLAISAWILFSDKRYNLTEHIVAFIYILSQYSLFSFIVSSALLIFFPEYYVVFGMIILVLVLLYALYILKRIFKISFGGMVPRAIGFFMLSTFSIFGLSIIQIVILLITGQIDFQDLIPKK